MRLSRASGKLQLVALMIIAGPLAMAQDSGWYIGANVGQTRAKIDNAGITSGLLGSGFATTSIDDHERDTGYKLFGGYQFNKYFAFEAGYFDLGKFSFNAVTVPAGTLDGQLKLSGENFDAVFNLPFTEKFSAFARAGVNYANVKDAFTGTGAVNVLNPNPSKRAMNYKFGGGLQYDFTKSFGMRAEVERYRIDDAVNNKADIDMASIGLLIRFGRKAPAPAPEPAPAPAPAPYVAPPEPVAPPPPERVVEAAPVEVIVPAPARTQEYCTLLDIQFEINRNQMQRKDKEKLAVIGTFLAKYPETTAVIEGHTDNVGKPEHNMKLSLQRAESVVNYLVNKLHIDRSRLRAVGYGDMRPIADNATNDGKRENRRIDAVVPCVTDFAGLKVAPARITMAMLIEFDANKADIKPEYDGQFQRFADFMKANPYVTATVEGNTGALQRTPEAAMKISLLRATNVVDYLVNRFGVERSRLTAEGFGATRSVAYNTSKGGREDNRRVNIIINYPKRATN